MTGAIIRHGPHHAAQKSTRKLPLRMASAKLASVSSIGCPPISGVLHLPQTAFLVGSSGNRLAWPQLGQRTMSFMRGTIAKGGPSRLREGERFTRRRGGAEKGFCPAALLRQTRRRRAAMERYIGRMLGRVYRLPVLPVLIRLRRFAQTDPAFLGMIGLEAGQQTPVAFRFVTLAVAVHLR